MLALLPFQTIQTRLLPSVYIESGLNEFRCEHALVLDEAVERFMTTIPHQLRHAYHGSLVSFKRLYYGTRGEPIRYGKHNLRYVPGTRPVRLKYVDSPNGTVRNDAKQISFFLEQLKPGDFVLDIGGHVGQYAVLFASLVSDSGQVISFEPDQSARAILEKNLALNNLTGRVLVEPLALFEVGGTHLLFSGGHADATAALIRPSPNSDKHTVLEQLVNTERLDDYISSRDLRCPDWIKLDTEGAEVNILRGARDTLKAGAKVACELHPYAWPQFGTTFQELLDLVSECGRTISYLDESLSIKDGAFYGAALIL